MIKAEYSNQHNVLLSHHIYSPTQWILLMLKPCIKILHHTKQSSYFTALYKQTIPPITLTYLIDNNIFLPLWFTLDKIKINSQASWCHRDDSRGLVDFSLGLLIGRPQWRPMGALAEITEGGLLSNGPSSKGHSNDIVGITELIVKHLHCRRFTVAP